MKVASLQKLRANIHAARKYLYFHHCERDGRKKIKYLCTRLAFKYTEESIITGLVFRLLHPCCRDSGFACSKRI